MQQRQNRLVPHQGLFETQISAQLYPIIFMLTCIWLLTVVLNCVLGDCTNSLLFQSQSADKNPAV